MKEGEVTPAMRVATGWVFATVTGRQDAYMPKLDEVKTRVADDVKQEKAAEMAKQRAAAIATELKGAKDFAAAVKNAGLEIKTTELIARGAAIPDLGISEAVDAAAFALPQGGVSDAISTPTGTAIIRVAEKVNVTDAEIEARQGRAARRAGQRAPRQVLRRLHAEGEAGPEDHDPRRHARARSSAEPEPVRSGVRLDRFTVWLSERLDLNRLSDTNT